MTSAPPRTDSARVELIPGTEVRRAAGNRPAFDKGADVAPAELVAVQPVDGHGPRRGPPWQEP